MFFFLLLCRDNYRINIAYTIDRLLFISKFVHLPCNPSSIGLIGTKIKTTTTLKIANEPIKTKSPKIDLECIDNRFKSTLTVSVWHYGISQDLTWTVLVSAKTPYEEKLDGATFMLAYEYTLVFDLDEKKIFAWRFPAQVKKHLRNSIWTRKMCMGRKEI